MKLTFCRRFFFSASIFLSAALMFVGAAANPAQAYPYDANHTFRTGYPIPGTPTNFFNYPYSAHIADFDGDGVKDFANANLQTHSVSVVLNNGNATFGLPETFEVHGDPRELRSGDIDGDGDVDLATVNYGSSTFSILYNQGDATFTLGEEYVLDGPGYDLQFGDVDNDEDQDIAIVLLNSNEVVLYLNDGEGAFTEDVHYAVQLNPRILLFADFNADENPDIVSVNYSSASISILLNEGDGTYATATHYATGIVNSIPADVADVDGDGDTDVLLVDIATGIISVLKNNGDGTFAAASLSPGNYHTSSAIKAADLDGDGDQDIVLAVLADYILTMMNDGTGAFVRGDRYMANRSTNSVAVGDLDGDGDIDVASSGGLSDNVSIFKNNGDGTFPNSFDVEIGGITTDIFSADFDNDGDSDILLNSPDQDQVFTLINNGDGTMAAPVGYATADYPYLLDIADVDGDGDMDIGTVHPYLPDVSTLEILLNNGDGTFAAGALYETGFEPDVYGALDLSFADVDGDGDPDAAVLETERNAVTLLLNDGSGVFMAAGSYTVGGVSFGMSSGDFDNDGDVDLVTSNFASTSLSILLSNGDGTFAAMMEYTDFPAGEGLVDVNAGDFNDDGNIDLVVSGEVAPAAYIIFGSGDGTFATPTPYSVGNWPDNIYIDDLDHDDDLDIAISVYSFNSVSLLMNNGDGTFHNPSDNVMTGRRPVGITAADFNGDGVKDLATANRATTTMSIVYSLMALPPVPTPAPVSSGGGGLGSSGSNALPPLVQTFQQVIYGLLLPAGVQPHALIKLPDDGDVSTSADSAVYYVGLDGKRHAFPNDKVYFSWYENFDGVQLVSETQLSSIPLGKNVTYKPGKRMVKFTTNNTVYAVAKGGVLRGIPSEAAASELYGAFWNTVIDDISDAFYTNYTFGQDMTGLADFNPTTVQASVQFPSDSLEM